MARNGGIAETYTTYREQIRLLGALVLTLVPAIFIANMVARAFTVSPLQQSVNQLLLQIGFTAQSLAAALLGVYFATIVLLYIDHTKRAQALLLALATVGALAILAVNDVFVPTVDLADVVLLIGGLAFGLVTVGGERLQYLQVSDTSEVLQGRIVEGEGQAPLEFPRAERVLFYLVGGLIVISFFEAHTQYPTPVTVSDGLLIINDITSDFTLTGMRPQVMAFDLVASGLFLWVFGWFLGYDAERSVFVLGPSGSGKTHLIIGLYLSAQDLGLRPRNTSDELVRQVQRMIDQKGFIEQRTREAQDLSFEFTSGRYFPKNVDLDAFDYPGEYLPHIPGGLDVLDEELTRYDYEDQIREQVDQGVAIDQRKGAVTDGGRQPSLPDGGTDVQETDPSTVVDIGDELIRERARVMVDEVCPRVKDADLLMFVVDINRYINGNSLGTEWYSAILQRLPDDKASIVVATKADLLLDEEDGYGVQPWAEPAEFRDSVDQLLREHMGSGGLSIPEKPYPVFYRTREEDGERKMDLGTPIEFGAQDNLEGQEPSPNLYGFERVLDRLGR